MLKGANGSTVPAVRANPRDCVKINVSARRYNEVVVIQCLPIGVEINLSGLWINTLRTSLKELDPVPGKSGLEFESNLFRTSPSRNNPDERWREDEMPPFGDERDVDGVTQLAFEVKSSGKTAASSACRGANTG